MYNNSYNEEWLGGNHHPAMFSMPQMVQQDRHMLITNVHKGRKDVYVTLDAKFRDNTTGSAGPNYTTSDPAGMGPSGVCQFTIPDRLTDVLSMRLVEATIPFTFYNVLVDPRVGLNGSAYNLVNDQIATTTAGSDVIQVVLGTVSYTKAGTTNTATHTITINQGYYTVTDLVTAINASLQSYTLQGFEAMGSSTINALRVGSDTIRKKLFFYHSTPMGLNATNTYQFDFNPASVGAYTRVDDLWQYNLGYRMGFRTGSTGTVVVGSGTSTQWMASHVVDLRSPRNLFITLDTFSANTSENAFLVPLSTGQMSTQVVAKIPVFGNPTTFNFGDTVMCNLPNGMLLSSTRRFAEKTHLGRLRLRIMDEFGRTVQFNGAEPTFTFHLEKE